MTYKRIEDVLLTQESGDFLLKDGKSNTTIARIDDYITPTFERFVSSLHESGRAKVLYGCQDRNGEFNQTYELLLDLQSAEGRYNPDDKNALLSMRSLNNNYVIKDHQLMKVKG